MRREKWSLGGVRVCVCVNPKRVHQSGQWFKEMLGQQSLSINNVLHYIPHTHTYQSKTYNIVQKSKVITIFYVF